MYFPYYTQGFYLGQSPVLPRRHVPVGPAFCAGQIIAVGESEDDLPPAETSLVQLIGRLVAPAAKAAAMWRG
jgi:hypothetical protein